MSWSLKTTLLVIMSTALTFGFCHHLIPPDQFNFERLHIFLFNLCSGGTLLLYYTENQPALSLRGRLFLFLAVCFAFCAFFQWYIPAILIAPCLGVIVEQIRIKTFGHLFPKSLFSTKKEVSCKFHQAALLCLSLALFLSSAAILNSEFTHWLTIEKLQLDTFFLGYSFPVSLISISIMFSLMRKKKQRIRAIQEATFWIINLGVIVFFLFILGELFLPQVAISSILFVTVALILYLFWKQGINLQQKTFLTSGILFLLATAITGIMYILLEFSSYYKPEYSQPLLRLHAFTSLYGWNLSGMAVIVRNHDFPIQLHSPKVIRLHWITVLLLCPLGYYFPFFAVTSIGCYCWLLVTLFFNHSRIDQNMIAREEFPA